MRREGFPCCARVLRTATTLAHRSRSSIPHQRFRTAFRARYWNSSRRFTVHLRASARAALSRMPMRFLTALVIALVCFSAPARASVEHLDLAAMVAKADGSAVGTITARRVVRIDSEIDGPELYFTILTLEGRSLATDAPVTLELVYAGGFVDAKHGVWNSEAPAADDVALGSRVVVFYAYTENMGGGMSGNALYAAHGGLYRTFDARRGAIVQGRGAGYAVDANLTLAELRTRVAQLELERRAREAAARKAAAGANDTKVRANEARR